MHKHEKIDISVIDSFIKICIMTLLYLHTATALELSTPKISRNIAQPQSPFIKKIPINYFKTSANKASVLSHANLATSGL